MPLRQHQQAIAQQEHEEAQQRRRAPLRARGCRFTALRQQVEERPRQQKAQAGRQEGGQCFQGHADAQVAATPEQVNGGKGREDAPAGSGCGQVEFSINMKSSNRLIVGAGPPSCR